MIKPLTLFEPVVHRFLRMLAKKIKVEVEGINATDIVGCGNVIHSMPAIVRKLLGATVHHILEFRVAQVFPVKYEDHTPKITLHCMNRWLAVAGHAVAYTRFTLYAAKTEFFAIMCRNCKQIKDIAFNLFFKPTYISWLICDFSCFNECV